MKNIEEAQTIQKKVDKLPYYLLIFLNIASIIAFFVVLMFMLVIDINLSKEAVTLEQESKEDLEDIILGIDDILTRLESIE